jgi:transposase-like protein
MFVGRKDDPDGNEETTHAPAGGAQANQADRMLGEDKEIADVCRELQVSEQTYYRWRNQFGGLKPDDVKRLKDLERENAMLKRLLAEAELEKAALREIARGNF